MPEDKVNVSIEDNEKKQKSKIESIKGKLSTNKKGKAKSSNSFFDKIKQFIDTKIVIVGLAVGILIALLLFFIFNLSGIRTTSRNMLVDALMGYERKVLEKQLRAEYDEKLEILVIENVRDEKEELYSQEKELEEQKKEIEKQTKELEAKENSLNKRQEELEEFNVQLKDKETLIDGKIDEIKSLVDIYEEMEPNASLNILINLDDEVLVRNILLEMDEKISSQILALMDSQKAADIINEMSERRE